MISLCSSIFPEGYVLGSLSFVHLARRLLIIISSIYLDAQCARVLRLCPFVSHNWLFEFTLPPLFLEIPYIPYINIEVSRDSFELFQKLSLL